MNKYLTCLSLAITALSSNCQTMSYTILYQSDKFSVYSNRVTEGKFTARAVSETELTSDYQSQENKDKSPIVRFKFSINGADNAAPSGSDCSIICDGSKGATPIIKFGQSYIDDKQISPGKSLQQDTKLTFRVDMRDVLKALNSKGFYTCFNGQKIYKNDFKGVYVAGSVAPLTWDFNNLYSHKELQLHDSAGDGIYTLTLLLNHNPNEGKTASVWHLSNNISAFPQYRSPVMLQDALYNLALDEMQNAIEPDSTFRTGKEWAGVWTRDISYSIILSMAILQPRVAVISLKRKVKNGKIVQDTGTGGAYPCSTDRVIWAVAAWEVYKVTGDKNWLEYAYTVIRNSIEDDVHNIYDEQTGLVKGESSFLDWREQTYPMWMQPADIYESECLGTNAVHYEANKVLSEMAAVLGISQDKEKYAIAAAKIKDGVNQYLWQKDKGYYGQYLYGRTYKILSSKSEALGEALSVLFDVANKGQQSELVANVPVTPYGISCIYPQIPGIPPYHNNAVWPFVESFWAQASAKAGNETSVVRAIASVYRPAALFLTNKENFVAQDGDYAGTQINSSNMLWSLSGNISIVYKVFFGISFDIDRLAFHPFVPKAFAGTRTLSNFKYRNAVLDIAMKGYGNKIKSFSVDGKNMDDFHISSALTGHHFIKIVLANNLFPNGKINNVPNVFAPQMPQATFKGNVLSWTDTSKNIAAYKIICNGRLWKTTKDASVIIDGNKSGEWQIVAMDNEGLESFASEPLEIYPETSEHVIELENFNRKTDNKYPGFSGNGYVQTTPAFNKKVLFDLDIKHNGTYISDIHYANGNGPINTENKCAIRALMEDEKQLGTFVFPQRGKDEWSKWGWSNSIKLQLTAGVHHFVISYEPYDENMNGTINEADLDCVRVINETR